MTLRFRTALAGIAVLAATPAMASTLVNGNGVTFIDANGINLNNNSLDGSVYVVREGTDANGVTSYLLHYGRGNNQSGDPSEVTGGFGIRLAAGETLFNYVTSTADLDATDPNSGAIYTRDNDRGLEFPSSLTFGDDLTVGNPNPIRVTFDFKTSTNSSDEARFFIRAVPEPATWAMMILGFGMVGVGLRRRSSESRVRFV